MQSGIDEELAKFQGTWRQVRCEADGVVNPADEFGPQPLTTFTGNHYVVTLPDGTMVIEGTFTLDPSQEPKAVNWTAAPTGSRPSRPSTRFRATC